MAKVKPGREVAVRESGSTIAKLVVGDPEVLAPHSAENFDLCLSVLESGIIHIIHIIRHGGRNGIL